MEILRHKLQVPDAVREIAQRLEEAGHATWAVGGAVRDALLGRQRSDWDLATAAPPEVVRKLFRPSYPIGIEFGTVGVRGRDGNVYEVTTFRQDIATDGRHAVVAYSTELDVDLERRDFTINAIAFHPLREELHDPFSGRADLEGRILRCVGEPQQRFAEDYLRILRGLRFAGGYGLNIEPATWSALRAAVPNLPRLSAERIREELMKVLVSRAPQAALDLYRESGTVATVFPELTSLDDAEWGELLRMVRSIPALRLRLRTAALLMPTGEGVEALMTRLRFSNAEISAAVALGRSIVLALPETGDAVAARRWIRDVTRDWARDTMRLHIARADARSAAADERSALAARIRVVLGVMRRGDPVAVEDLAIDGHSLKSLGLSPGPEFSRVLAEAVEAVIEDPELNEHDRLLEYVREKLLAG